MAELPALSPEQSERLHHYVERLLEINTRVNLISRKDTADVYNRHVVHSLALASRPFITGSIIVDWGTGGGLPAIPLAVCFPSCSIVAVDSIGKKARAVEQMAAELGLSNLSVWNGRAEQWRGKAHYSVSRAAASLTTLWDWHKRVRIPAETVDDCWPPGLLCLKGGDLTDEIAQLERAARRVSVEVEPIADFGPGFPDKSIVLVRSTR